MKRREGAPAACRLLVVETGEVLAERARVARTPWARAVGLLGRRELPPGEALVLLGTRWVHTLFMRFPIDVLYLDRKGQVIAVDRQLPPWRIPRPRLRAATVVELPAGAATRVEPGMHVRFLPTAR